MHTRAVHNSRLGRLVLVRPLADGDTATVAALFERLGDASRSARYHGTKPRLPQRDLACLAAVGPDSHVLVAYVDGDPLPAGMARLARHADDRRAGEVAFEVADRYQGSGIGTLLVESLLADARAAGFLRVDAVVQPSNRAALGLLRRTLDRLTLRMDGDAILAAAPLR